MMVVASFLVISFAQFLPKSVGRPVSSRMPSFLSVFMFFLGILLRDVAMLKFDQVFFF